MISRRRFRGVCNRSPRRASRPGRASRTYDTADRITQRRTGLGIITSFPTTIVRDATGRPTSFGYQRYVYDTAGMLARVCFNNPTTCDAGAAATIGYTYDGLGNRLTETRTGVPDPGTITSTYDDAGQLTTRGPTTYTHDADGNLTSDGTTTYTYDVHNQLTNTDTTADTAYTYDGLGNRTTITRDATTRALSWDINNPIPTLTSVDAGVAAAFTDYTYDPHGRPIRAGIGTAEYILWSDPLGSVLKANPWA